MPRICTVAFGPTLTAWLSVKYGAEYAMSVITVSNHLPERGP